MTGQLLVDRDGPVLTVTFSRPAQRNAMTWEMYDGLLAACERADADEQVRVLVLRGAGTAAFVAGTDISQFAGFASGADGVAYEERIGAVLRRLQDVDVPTVAAVGGYCIGGGLAIAASCDLRLATRESQFGVPVARTLGNCLSVESQALLTSHLGPARTLDLLLRARLLTAAEAHAAGFVAELCEPEELEALTDRVVRTLLRHAPLTMWAAKEANRRLLRRELPDDEDLVSRVYGSSDFGHGVAAFRAKEKPAWTGR